MDTAQRLRWSEKAVLDRVAQHRALHWAMDAYFSAESENAKFTRGEQACKPIGPPVFMKSGWRLDVTGWSLGPWVWADDKDDSRKPTVTSGVIQKPGMWKEASASLIQHGLDDCLPLLSLLTVFTWLRIHASSLVCVPIPPGHGRMARDGSCDWSKQFPKRGGSSCLWRWLITADSFVSHIVT